MAQILVRDLEEEVVKKLKKRARLNGRSLQAEVRLILESEAYAPKVDMETARALALKLQKKFKKKAFPDSVKLIREDRDSR
jgi:plasmid stability protein